MFVLTYNGETVKTSAGRRISARDLQTATLKAFQYAVKTCRTLCESSPWSWDDIDEERAARCESIPRNALGASGKRYQLPDLAYDFTVIDDKTGEEAARIIPRFYLVSAGVNFLKTGRRRVMGHYLPDQEVEHERVTGVRFSLTTEINHD